MSGLLSAIRRRSAKSETRKAKFEGRRACQDATIMPRSLHCGPQTARSFGRDDNGCLRLAEKGSSALDPYRAGQLKRRRSLAATHGRCKGGRGRYGKMKDYFE